MQERYLGLNILGYIQTNVKDIQRLEIPILEYSKIMGNNKSRNNTIYSCIGKWRK